MDSTKIDWKRAEEVRDMPEINEAIRNLLADQTGDNATCLVRSVLAAASHSKGLRELPAETLALVNKIKAHGEATRELCEEVHQNLQKHFDDTASMTDTAAKIAEYARLQDADPFGWMRTGKKELQSGLMKLIRAVAQPTSF
jgi:hypothetical protein